MFLRLKYRIGHERLIRELINPIASLNSNNENVYIS